VSRRVGVHETFSKRVDSKGFKWFGDVDRMGSERLAKRVYTVHVRNGGNKGEREAISPVDRSNKQCT